MPRMYHPATGAEIDYVVDDPEQIAVHAESGWLIAPEPEAIPGHEPEPATYVPVEKPRAKTAKKTETAEEQPDK